MTASQVIPSVTSEHQAGLTREDAEIDLADLIGVLIDNSP